MLQWKFSVSLYGKLQVVNENGILGTWLLTNKQPSYFLN